MREYYNLLDKPQEAMSSDINEMVNMIHQRNIDAGWFNDIHTGEPLKRNIGEMMMLINSELVEAFEGHRKNLMDDHLPNRKMCEVELADTFIRLLDLAGYLGFDLGGAVVEKMQYNLKREDHKLENRLKENGKKI